MFSRARDNCSRKWNWSTVLRIVLAGELLRFDWQEAQVFQSFRGRGEFRDVTKAAFGGNFFFFFHELKTLVVTSTRFESRSANCNPFRNFHTLRNTRNRYYVISTIFIPRNYGVSFFLLTLNSPISESNRRFFFPFVYNIFLFAFDITNGA